MNLANNFEEILVAFRKHNVEFIIAGGYAVIFHGYGRTTGDLDIWVKPSEENKKNILMVFENLKYDTIAIDLLRNLDFSKPFSFVVGEEPICVDIFNFITGVTYAEAEKNAVHYQYSNLLDVKFIHLFDLIKNKMLTGRIQDKADVDQLQRINIHSEDKKTVSFLKKLFGKSK